MTKQPTASTGSAERPVWTSDNCPLTRRKLEILHYMACGNTAPQTAKALSLSTETIRTHLHDIHKALHCHKTIAAVVIAVKAGWIL